MDKIQLDTFSALQKQDWKVRKMRHVHFKFHFAILNFVFYLAHISILCIQAFQYFLAIITQLPRRKSPNFKSSSLSYAYLYLYKP